MKSRYRIKIASPKPKGDRPSIGPPRYFYTIADGLNGPIIKSGSSCSIKGWIGAWYAAEKTIKRLMLKERSPIDSNIRIRQHLSGELETTDKKLLRDLWKTWLEVACQNPCPVCGNNQMSHDDCPVGRVEQRA